jgi:DNA-directed RNA polymerase specialized sigma24 family protein
VLAVIKKTTTMLYSFDHHATGPQDICELQVAPNWAQEYPETDEQLMAHIQQGDEAALGILLYRHIRACRAVIQRVLRDEREADLIAQHVFAEVSRESARYTEAAGPVIGWIMTLARRRAVDRLRERQGAGRPSVVAKVINALNDLHPADESRAA